MLWPTLLPLLVAFAMSLSSTLRERWPIILAGLVAGAACAAAAALEHIGDVVTAYDSRVVPLFAPFLLVGTIAWAVLDEAPARRVGALVYLTSVGVIFGGVAAALVWLPGDPLIALQYLMWLPLLSLFGGFLMDLRRLRVVSYVALGIGILIVVVWIWRDPGWRTHIPATVALAYAVATQVAGVGVMFQVMSFRERFAAERERGDAESEARSRLEQALERADAARVRAEIAQGEADAARAAADEANRAKSEFLAHMSHDLRTPLNAIIGFSELASSEALGGAEAWPRYRAYAAHVHESGEFLLSLVDEILELARGERGDVPLQIEPVDLAQLASCVLARLKPLADAAGVNVTLEARVTHVVHGDLRALERVLQNLVGNAIKFTPAGRRAGITLSGAGAVARIEVWDEGEGMSAEDLVRLGEPFYRSRSARLSGKTGTGLGYAVVQKLVERHGGTIEARSAIGEGTSVTITLPTGEGAGAP
jgi:signal transduction histidine kinase